MNDELSVDIGAFVRRRRRRLNLTQEVLAERAGISVRTLISVENGIASARSGTLRALGVALELNGDELHAFLSGNPHAVRLPAFEGKLIGRDAEQADLLALLRGGVRALALTGPPGVGKSRLAAAVARRAAPQFDDGAWFVSLTDAASDESVVNSIGDVLGLRLSAGGDAVAMLVRALTGKRLLLILDNIDELRLGPFAATLLEAATALHILATTRNRGSLAGSREYLLAPLPTPDRSQVFAVDRILASPAVAYFALRARLIDPAFTVDERNAGDVSTCVAALDGLPLAIELAAPYLRIYALEDLAKRLASSQALVIDRSDAGAQSSKTLRKTLELSYGSLDDLSRKVLEAAATFRDGAEIDALAAVAGYDRAAIDLALLTLIERSLLSLGPDRRIRQLYVIREFIDSHVPRASRDELRRAHVQYFLTRFEGGAFQHLPAAERQRLYDLEMGNIDRAFECAIEAGDVNVALRLFIATDRLMRASRLRHGLYQAERAIEAAASYPDADVRALAMATYKAATFRYEAVEYDRARVHLTRARDLFASVGDTLYGDMIDQFMGGLLTSQGLLEQAKVFLESSLARFAQLTDKHFFGWGLLNLSASLELEERYDEALDTAARALEIFSNSGNESRASGALLALGQIELTRGNREAAREHVERALAIRRAHDDRMEIAQALVVLALIRQADGDREAARELLREAVALNRRVQDGHNEAKLLLAVAGFALECGRSEAAAALLAAHRSRHISTYIEPLWKHERAALSEALATIAPPQGTAIEELLISALANGATDQG